MKNEELIQYCLKHKGAYLDYPFGEEPVCVKVNGKIFAEIYLAADNYKVTLKSEAMQADFYRQQYPETVVRGYHCPSNLQPYWNTVYLNKGVSDTEILQMIDDSYSQVFKTFSKKNQAEIEHTNP